MDSGHEHWWDLWREWALGALATITTAATGIVGYMFRHYRRHKKMLEEDHKYVRRLKRRRVLALTMAHDRELKEIGSKLESTSKLADQLDDHIKSLSNVAMSLQGSVTNLTTLVDARGKEHHQLRDMLQPITMRLTVLETKFDIEPHDI